MPVFSPLGPAFIWDLSNLGGLFKVTAELILIKARNWLQLLKLCQGQLVYNGAQPHFCLSIVT